MSAEATIETLTITELTEDITPQTGTSGVFYGAFGAATLLSNTSDFTIKVTGADGIFVSSETADTFIRHSGDISVSDGRGIVAAADNGAAAIEGSGDVTATGDAINIDPRLGSASVNWTGNLDSSQSRGLFVKADNGGASVEGAGTIDSALDAVTVDARGANGDASFNWTGDITSNQGDGVLVSSANGGASAEGAGTIDSALDAVTVDARGADGDASFNWTGDITSDQGDGILVTSANGGASVEGAGDVMANGFGLDIRATGTNDNASLTWDGAITSATHTGAYVQADSGGATLKGEGNVTAAEDGLYADSAAGNALIDWTGDIVAGRYGILADADNGGATVRGSGDVSGVAGGIVARNRSSTTAVVDWQGDVTATDGQAISVTSANGATTVKGAGVVQGASDGISVRNTGSQTASLNWVGDITGSTGFGAEVYSSNGAVASATVGEIRAGTGGIYAASEGNAGSIVSVTHEGGITADGVGIEARSPQAPVSVKLTGDIDAGSFGIYALSEGSSIVSIEMIGDILRSGHAGIDARSSRGAVAVTQSGVINTQDAGIVAQNEGGGTVSVVKTGDLKTALNGIDAQSSTGVVTVTMSDGVIDAGGTAIRAVNLGDTTVNVALTGDVIRSSTAVDARSANGAVYVATTGDLQSSGTGIQAHSGGAGEVGVTHSGDLTATNGTGISASSASGDISTYVLSGNVTAANYGLHLAGAGNFAAGIGADARVIGGADFAGVYFEDGLSNSLTNAGWIGNTGGIDAFAIRADGNDIAIDNFGTISGNIVLGPFANALRNHEGGLLETGSVLTMAAGDTLRNSGTITVGRSGEVQTTALTGSLETSLTSRFVLDLDMAANSDRIDLINVSGSASLAGGVSVNVMSVSGGPQRYTFITTGEGVTAQNLVLDELPFLNGVIETREDQDVDLVINEIIFAPLGISGNARDIAGYFQRAVGNGETGVSEIATQLANLDSVAAGQLLYEQLSPEIALSALTNIQASGVGFADNMMSCRVASGLNAAIAEGDCDWFKTSYASADRTTDEAPDTTTTTKLGFSGGFQRAIDMSDWRVGAALGLSDLQAESASGSAEGTHFHAGAVVKYAPGAFVLSAGLSNSWGLQNMRRSTDLGGGDQILLSETDTQTTDLNLRGAYAFDRGSYYIKPQLDLHAVRVRADAYTETGGSAALSIDALDDTYFSLAPSVELGADLLSEDGHVTRGFLRLGTTLYSGAGIDLQGRLASDLSAQDSFVVSAGNDRAVVDVSAGLTSFSMEGWSAEFLYTGNFAENIDQHSVMLKLSAQF